MELFLASAVIKSGYSANKLQFILELFTVGNDSKSKTISDIITMK